MRWTTQGFEQHYSLLLLPSRATLSKKQIRVSVQMSVRRGKGDIHGPLRTPSYNPRLIQASWMQGKYAPTTASESDRPRRLSSPSGFKIQLRPAFYKVHLSRPPRPLIPQFSILFYPKPSPAFKTRRQEKDSSFQVSRKHLSARWNTGIGDIYFIVINITQIAPKCR